MKKYKPEEETLIKEIGGIKGFSEWTGQFMLSQISYDDLTNAIINKKYDIVQKIPRFGIQKSRILIDKLRDIYLKKRYGSLWKVSESVENKGLSHIDDSHPGRLKAEDAIKEGWVEFERKSATPKWIAKNFDPGTWNVTLSLSNYDDTDLILELKKRGYKVFEMIEV